ncbi:putative dual specificity protein phosphatase [Trypanosoma theileri]|uniref:protein-tyrosine-phosphatase n=1 Tax=Trypanosoma theileri TaxID=67003 RepID=A0A1X0P6D0_9TRYP|nr:putative dual specificity protein phosphatase [Trypanosoma theileri]ORC91990.1 putative dual specificity protein phosphatase [Trypanosoma theileri]
MAARSCTPPRDGASPDGTPFVCYHHLSDYRTEGGNSASSSEKSKNSNNSPCTPTRRYEGFCGQAVDFGVEQWSSQTMTPKNSRIETIHPSAALCTPQTMREELQLRSNLDAELSSVKLNYMWHTAPAVTPLVDGLYVGGFPDEETLDILRREGICTIINCCAGEYETHESVKAEFTVHDFSAEDQNDYLILYHCYDRFAEVVNEAKRLGSRVFVHCIAGINRSVTLCAAYIMQYHHMDPVTCVRLFRAQGRTDILRNVSFRHQLVDFYLNTLSA